MQMEAHWTHFLPVADKVREIIDSGVLGDIKHVDSKYLSVFSFDSRTVHL